MKADLLIKGISQLVTAEGSGPKRGRAMRELKIVESAAIGISSGTIVWTGREADWSGETGAIIDVSGGVVVPGLVDPHTHAVWAGDRLNDFEARTAGRTYEEILAAGGGIRSTIRATAAASQDQLVAMATPRIDSLVSSGATTIEVKSGYGFTPTAEVAMLEAIQSLSKLAAARIVSTLLIHIPPAALVDRPVYISQVCEELIPEVAQRKLATAVDIFIEKEAWQVAEAEQIFDSARQYGLSIKLHSDQFHSIGGVELGLRLGAFSIDHLEASGTKEIMEIASGSTIATILPGVSLHLGIPAAPGRQLIDAGAAVAVGTDLNPGSSPLFSASEAMALSVRLNGLTPQEAFVAGTVNAACALGLENVGRLEVGCVGDFLVLHGKDWRELVYTLGTNPVQEVWIGGKRVRE
ncbi:MAG TPA: imidazolonepropionase [Edaphobacter sp.]|jgi:imidazolonepropionase|nr:imidazolonepropionase [Edaphobacter sp.]